jgi:hypothetical protein
MPAGSAPEGVLVGRPRVIHSPIKRSYLSRLSGLLNLPSRVFFPPIVTYAVSSEPSRQ